MSSFESTKAPEPVGPYPHAKRVGDLLYLSGIGPRQRGSKDIPGVVLDPSGRMVDYDIEVQTRSVIENAKIVLEEAGSSLDNVVDILAFLVNIERDFAGYNKVYGEYFGGDGGKPWPARTTVEVGALPKGGNAPIAIELKIIATV